LSERREGKDEIADGGGSALGARMTKLVLPIGALVVALSASAVFTTILDADSGVVVEVPDTDSDGCNDQEEQGQSQAQGGLRNPENFWDFFDTPPRNGAVAGGDFFAILARFGAAGIPGDPMTTPPPTGYHSAYDRGPSSGPYSWNLTAANGAITGTDFFAVLGQFGHTCDGPGTYKVSEPTVAAPTPPPTTIDPFSGETLPPGYASWDEYLASLCEIDVYCYEDGTGGGIGASGDGFAPNMADLKTGTVLIEADINGNGTIDVVVRQLATGSLVMEASAEATIASMIDDDQGNFIGIDIDGDRIADLVP
jgi:hypothetical protein